MLDRGDNTVHGRIDRARTRAVNRSMAARVHRYVIARDEAVLTRLAPIGDEAARTLEGRMSVG
jgi:hypothetical protein